MNSNPYKSGDLVYVDGEGDSVFTVYAVYGDTKVSLGLREYPDTEQDYQTDIAILTPVGKK
jgi:hypothetical protein